MEPLDLIDKLAARARQERPPDPDVGSRILAGIRAHRPMSLAPLWFYAGWLTPTAAAVTLLANRGWSSVASWLSSIYWAGPLDGFLSPLRQVMP